MTAGTPQRTGRRVPSRVGRAALALLWVMPACGGEAPAGKAVPAAPAAATAPAASEPRTTPARPKVVILGDSLTAGLGLPQAEAYPTLLQERIDGNQLSYEIVNAGVSGDTSAAGLRRLDWALEGNVRVLVVALGANDGLRGLPADALKQNLDEIIRRAKARHITVVLAGMEALPNLGPDYAKAFHDVYPALAKTHDVPLVPFLLDGVAGVPALNQTDGIHPTEEGARRVADNVWSVLEPVLRRERAQ